MVKPFSVEGQLDFDSVLLCPKRAPFDMFKECPEKKHKHIKLYVHHVFIIYNYKDLTPEWLSFIKGGVDSEDQPLNISCEMLQQNKILQAININWLKKCNEMFIDSTENEDVYNKFYEAFSKNFYHAKLAQLLHYHLTKNGDSMTSLKVYMCHMDDRQLGL